MPARARPLPFGPSLRPAIADGLGAKGPEGHRPNPSDIWSAKVDWVGRGPGVRSRGHPCPVGRPRDPRGPKRARRRGNATGGA
jgi:hypothetical protein